MEQLGLQIDLAVRDGNDVRRNIGRDVAGLCFDNGQGRHGAAAVFRGDAGRALEQTGVQIEHVAGVGLASGRAADEQGKGTVGHGVLRQVVIDDEHVLALIHEVFAHGAAGVRRDILQRSQLRGSCGDNDGIVHGAAAGERIDELGDGRALLADGDIDADDVLALLVQNGIRCDDGLAGLAVADDELALAAADGDHGVDGLDAGLQRDADGLALDDAGGVALDGAQLLRVDGALAVNGLAEGVDDAADEGLADRDGHDAARALDKAALADADVRAEHDDADAALLEVQRHAERAVLEAEQLVGLAFIQPVHLGDAVADLNDVADLILLRLGCIIFDLILDDLTDIVDSEIHGFTNLIF